MARSCEFSRWPLIAPAGSGSGYVVDCLHSARVAVEQLTFERVVQRAVSLGNDTDTTAAPGIANERSAVDLVAAGLIRCAA